MTDHISASPVPFAPAYPRADARAYVHIVRTDRHLVNIASVDFALADKKGRAIGHTASIIREVHAYGTEQAHGLCLLEQLPLWIGESFVVQPQSLRDGKRFGPILPAYRVKTLAEAEAKREAVFANARKAASKRVGG